MTDTSPVAKLNAGLPKGNGLTRAVPMLFDQRGTLVPFVGVLRVKETGLDDDDVEHLRASIERFELCLGALERDGKDLLARCSTAATSVEGQQTLFADQADFEAQRKELLGVLTEWAQEQWPDVDDSVKLDELLAEQWRSWHGGHYDARPDHGAPAHLREFALSVGALADSEPDGTVVDRDLFGEDPPAEDVDADLDSDLDDQADDDEQTATVVPFSGDAP